MKKTAIAFVLLFFVGSLSFGQSPRGKATIAQEQPKGEVKDQYYLCDGFYLSGNAPSNWQPNAHFLSGVFEAKGTNLEVNDAWLAYLAAKYGGRPSGVCSIGDPASLERLRARPKIYPIVHVDWKYTAGATAPDPASNGRQTGNVPVNSTDTSGLIAKEFIYCYSVQEGGMNSYFSDVFPVELPATRLGMGTVPDDASVNRIQEAFYSYLKQKGYTFKSGRPGAQNCEFRTDEQSAKALKHRRAYEGSPCSNCGKTVETGWTPTGTSVVPSPTAIEHKPTSTSRRPDISGTYTGAYRCAQGSVHLKLTLMGSQEGTLTGQFTFDLLPTSGARTATYSLSGSFDEAGKFRLDPVKWDSPEPPGYVMVGMEGTFDTGTQQVSGKITNPTCSTFEATRKKP